MTGIGTAAAAILGVQPGRPHFPRFGIITAVTVTRADSASITPGLAIGIGRLTVAVGGVSYDCGASGAFLAEVTASGGSENAFIGRQVKVESIGGALLVAYTVNWS